MSIRSNSSSICVVLVWSFPPPLSGNFYGREDAKAAEEAKKAEAESVVKRLLASGMSADEISAVREVIDSCFSAI